MRPAGIPTPFRAGFRAGYFVPEAITLANVPPGSNAVLQVCAWEGNYGCLIEKARRSHDLVWRPFAVLTNVTGTVTFTDTVDSGATNVWFRARILD